MFEARSPRIAQNFIPGSKKRKKKKAATGNSAGNPCFWWVACNQLHGWLPMLTPYKSTPVYEIKVGLVGNQTTFGGEPPIQKLGSIIMGSTLPGSLEGKKLNLGSLKSMARKLAGAIGREVSYCGWLRIPFWGPRKKKIPPHLFLHSEW